jgi:hypothetical protein
MIGNAWLRQEPSVDSDRLGLVVERGQEVKILAVSGDWYQIRWVPATGVEAIGWVPLRWVGTLEPIPAWMITPTANP